MIKFGTDGWRAIVDEEFNQENVERVTLAIGKYIYLETSEVFYYATLLNVDNEELELEYLQKNIKKKTKINYKDIKLIRLAIKF